MGNDIFYVGIGGVYRDGQLVSLPTNTEGICELLNSTYRLGCEANKPCTMTEPVGFTRFWEAWPKHWRKDGRKRCLSTWRSRLLEHVADNIMASLEQWKRSAQWANGDFIPKPLTWLNASTWLAEPPKPAARIAAAQVHDHRSDELKHERAKQAAHDEAVANCIGSLDNDECAALLSEYQNEQPVARNVSLNNPRVREWIYFKKHKDLASNRNGS